MCSTGRDLRERFQRHIFAREKFAMYQIASWTVGVVESVDEVGAAQASQIADGAYFVARRKNAVNAPFVGAGADIELCEAFGGNPARVLDDEAIHVDDPEGAVGSGSDLHWSEPIVGAGEEFAALFV